MSDEKREPVDPENDGHIMLVHTAGECDNRSSCMFCDGGLSACTRCGAFEGSWPDHCPGEQMTEQQSDAVYSGELNYRGGEWRQGECCQVMRHAHDTDAYMAEHGYRRGEGDRWIKVDSGMPA